MSNASPPLYRPIPRRPFSHKLLAQQPPSPHLAPSIIDDSPSRTQSFLNLTSSTLLGIYHPSSNRDDIDQPSTPWGMGAETPTSSPPQRAPVLRQKSYNERTVKSTGMMGLGLRGVTLFGFGMLYGLLVRHLHDEQQLAPFQVEGIIKPRNDWQYLVFWGLAGVALGTLQPWVDALLDGQSDDELSQERAEKKDEPEISADWTPVVRSFGAFVGIAFAIRKLPWTSTLQVSLTLALVNPVLWYVIDRSKPGFILSATVGALGTSLLSLSDPALFPSPAPAFKNTTFHHRDLASEFGGYLDQESVEGAIWILSVLFCSCVCFGNIGRRLSLSGGRTHASVIGKGALRRTGY